MFDILSFLCNKVKAERSYTVNQAKSSNTWTDRPLIEVPHLIIGAGIAGLSLALKLARQSKVLLIAKGGLEESNTWFAQGGIASVIDKTDSFAHHIADTIQAGAGLCHEDIVRLVVESGPRLIQELVDMGVPFTEGDGQTLTDLSRFHLSKEGGHSHRRVVHAKDVTGRVVAQSLITAVKQNPNIEILEHQIGIDLIVSDKIRPQFEGNHCLGAYVMDRRSRAIYTVNSEYTYLCTGGHGKVYLYTSNPDLATGDGLAMGWRAGAQVANLEFMQFHPTCLYHPDHKTFLISEALRGEGAQIKNLDGVPFVDEYHHLGSLAPRDIVARAIDLEIKRSGKPHVYLDATKLGGDKLQTLFPNIMAICKNVGIDPSKKMIPVVPAAHYSCGGLVVDTYGQTRVKNLFALGEVACTGLHGANRLASNSLLEALVFADRIAQYVDQKPINLGYRQTFSVPGWNDGKTEEPDELVVLSHTWDEIRRLMWNYVGIVRTDKRLKRALERIQGIRNELDSYYWDFKLTPELIEVRNLSQVAFLTIRSALARKESRGIHFNTDHPETDLSTHDTVLW
jgi:L-aspartate oxidase